MGMILTKIQYVRTGTTDLTSDEQPFYEKDGKFYLKDTDKEVVIVEEDEIIL